MSRPRPRSRRDLAERRHRRHSCWDHLLVASARGRPRHAAAHLRRVELVEGALALGDLPAATRRTVIVLGHEQTGIPPEALDVVEAYVEIPMVGTGASLDVAVAGSLVLYRLAGLL